MTQSRYDTVQLEKGMSISAREAGGIATHPVAALSGGTMDQMYLAVRLAICEHVLPAETPLVLDDALVYFDDVRMAQALELLQTLSQTLSQTRQVLLFSCQTREAAWQKQINCIFLWPPVCRGPIFVLFVNNVLIALTNFICFAILFGYEQYSKGGISRMASSRKLGVALMQFNRAFRRYADRATADLPSMPLTGVQGLVVRHLYLCGKCGRDVFQRDIEKEFELGRSTVSETLRTMETNGMIYRVPVPYDARLKKLVLSECIQQHMEVISARIDLADQQLTQALTEEELKMFWQILDKLEHAMERTTVRERKESPMIKQLSGAIREYKKASILAPLFVVLEVLMEVLIPLVMASLIDNGIEVGNLPYVVKIGLVLILMALASLFFGIMSGRKCRSRLGRFCQKPAQG